MKLSTLFQGSIFLLGVFSAANFFAAPANAQQAAARAAASVTRPSSLTESISGEVLLPDGYYFTPGAGGTLTVTPTYEDAGTTSQSLSALSFDAGTPTAVSVPGTISQTVTAMLKGTNVAPGVNAATIEDAAAIIKAAAGVDGLE